MEPIIVLFLKNEIQRTLREHIFYTVNYASFKGFKDERDIILCLKSSQTSGQGKYIREGKRDKSPKSRFGLALNAGPGLDQPTY